MKKLLSDCLTGKDNITWDVHRIGFGISMIIFWILTAAEFVISHTFDPVKFGTGLGAITAGSGVGLLLKSKDEPSQKVN